MKRPLGKGVELGGWTALITLRRRRITVVVRGRGAPMGEQRETDQRCRRRSWISVPDSSRKSSPGPEVEE